MARPRLGQGRADEGLGAQSLNASLEVLVPRQRCRRLGGSEGWEVEWWLEVEHINAITLARHRRSAVARRADIYVATPAPIHPAPAPEGRHGGHASPDHYVAISGVP